MDFEELVEKIQKLCEPRSKEILDQDEIDDIMCGGCGQYDDTFDCGCEHGEATMAKEIIDLIHEEMQP